MRIRGRNGQLEILPDFGEFHLAEEIGHKAKQPVENRDWLEQES